MIHTQTCKIIPTKTFPTKMITTNIKIPTKTITTLWYLPTKWYLSKQYLPKCYLPKYTDLRSQKWIRRKLKNPTIGGGAVDPNDVIRLKVWEELGPFFWRPDRTLTKSFINFRLCFWISKPNDFLTLGLLSISFW